MDKIKRIDEFLHLIAEISKNGVTIDSNLVYSNLIRLGTEKKPIRNYFASWQDRFDKVQNIDVYETPEMKNFCQFYGYNGDLFPETFLKMYVPLDELHIYHGVNKLFDFISKYNIPHMSKVSNYTRFDDVVIIVDSINSLLAIKQFVTSDEYIKEGLIDPNPFTFSDGEISCTWDGELSYNTVVSEWISEYINSMKDNLDSISYSSFYEYVGKRYKEVFINGNNINDFHRGRKFENSSRMLANYQRVTELLLIALRKESKLIDLYKFYSFAKDKESVKEAIENIERLERKDLRIVEDVPDEIKEAYDYAFLTISKKEDIESAITRFKRFSNEGNYNLFTRKESIRELMQEMLDIHMARRIVYDEQKEALINASLRTIDKYNSIQLGRALFSVENGDYKGFTNDDNSRDKLMLWVEPNELKELIHRILYEEGYEGIKDSEEYWIFIEWMSRFKEQESTYGKV